MEGRIEAIFVTPEHGQLPTPVERVQARAGAGLEGNRYYWDGGDAPPGTAVTLIAAEAVEAAAEDGLSVHPAETRRNVLTRGVDVNSLVGKRFKIGNVECEGVELCEPCAHLESMTQPGMIKRFVHRGGLNADILSDGEISVGDAVSPA